MNNTINCLCQEIKDIGTNNHKHKISIALDFDGTVVEHEYPYIGKENGNCSEILKRWVRDYNVEIVLDTMRGGALLKDALKWFSDRNVPIFSVGKHPIQESWTDSPKAYALFSIDDRNVGCPVKYDGKKRVMVDWDKICEVFEPTLEIINKKMNG